VPLTGLLKQSWNAAVEITHLKTLSVQFEHGAKEWPGRLALNDIHRYRLFHSLGTDLISPLHVNVGARASSWFDAAGSMAKLRLQRSSRSFGLTGYSKEYHQRRHVPKSLVGCRLKLELINLKFGVLRNSFLVEEARVTYFTRQLFDQRPRQAGTSETLRP